MSGQPERAKELLDPAATPLAGAGGADPMGDARRRRADRARQVADVLRRQVLAGVFAGRTLPAEPRLAANFGVSRNAVRAALDLLRAEGLVDRVPGVGTVPATPKYPHGLDGLPGLGEVMRGHGEVSNEVRTTGTVTPPAPIAARLDVPAGSPVVYIERLRRLGGLPLSLDLTYLAPDVGRTGSCPAAGPTNPPHQPTSDTSLETGMPLVESRADVPVTIDASLCVEGCTLCVDMCSLDSLAIDTSTGKAYMHVDECWYCGPCAARCPTGAVTANMPYLLR
jgi:NAD-dependent dihydropyrimidine dehydrogenase PreA subunit